MKTQVICVVLVNSIQGRIGRFLPRPRVCGAGNDILQLPAGAPDSPACLY